MVIGGAGFIGSHTVRLLLERGHRVTVFDNLVRGENNLEWLIDHVPLVLADVRDRATVAGAIGGRDAEFVPLCDGGAMFAAGVDAFKKQDAVLHLAALWLNECKDRPREGWDVNANGTMNVVEACAESKVRLVFASSASVYGQPSYLPMDEGHPLNDNTLYGASKIAGERLLRAYHETHGLSYMALRYFNVFGPGQDDKGAYVGVIAKSLKRMREGLPPVVYGNGEQSYDFVHVDDVARANVLALESGEVGTVNACTGKAVSINEVVAILMDAIGFKGEPERIQGGGPVTKRIGDPSRAVALLGFRAVIGLKGGLRETARSAMGDSCTR